MAAHYESEVQSRVKRINEQRQNAWEQGKALLDNAYDESRTLTAEEKEQYDRISDDIKRYDDTRDALLSSERAQRELETVNESLKSISSPVERESVELRSRRQLEDFFSKEIRQGQPRKMEIDLGGIANYFNAVRSGLNPNELRAVIGGDTGASGGSLTIPTEVASTVYSFMTASVALRRMNTTVLTTDGGNPLTFPRTATHGIATQVANQDTAFAGTDPVLSAMTLNAFDFGELVAVGADLLEDTGVNLLDYVGRQVGRAVGQLTATQYVTGSGSGAPNGVMTAIGGAGTIATGGSLLLGPAGREVEKLIDLQYSVVDSYRVNGASWLMRDLTGAAVRKLRDGAGGTAGQFLWQPSATVGLIGGQPDTFLGDPVYFDPNVASMASDAKIIAYGDFSAYYIRDVRGFRLDRSDDLLFNKNQIAFRGLLRTDGDLIDTNAINILHQVVA